MIVMRKTAGGVMIDGKLIPLRDDGEGAPVPRQEPSQGDSPSVEDVRD
jgi:hypothetical protein